jgi:Cys-tRNA(Pro)/Cys-tRNA(Cys) deacylase
MGKTSPSVSFLAIITGGEQSMTVVNNVTRYLDAHKVRYVVFETPPEKLGAEGTASFLGVALELIYKTIVVKRERGKPILAVIPGNSELDLKALATALGEKKVHLPTEKEAEGLTGLQAGGISPLALINKGFQVVIDASAQAQAEIHVSGGQRGLNIRLAPGDLARLTSARFAPIGRKNNPES